jgi:hypothetical protein
MVLSNKGHYVYNITFCSWCVVYWRSEHIDCFLNETSSDYVQGSLHIQSHTNVRDWVHLVRRPLTVIDDECGAVGGMRIGRGNRSTRIKPAPVPLCPPQIPHDLPLAQTRTAVMGRTPATNRLSYGTACKCMKWGDVAEAATDLMSTIKWVAEKTGYQWYRPAEV